jgi:hypothetical protein
MGFGRFVCVGVPFGLTIASLICILIVMLNGITDKSLDMFEVDTKNLSISSSSLQNFVNEVKKRDERDLGHLTTAALNGAANGATNFTAAQLGLADSYKVYMWNYCSTTGSKTNCTSAKFDWASDSLNITAINARASSASGTNATLPKDVSNALKTFATVSKWTQVVYIIAFILTVLELVVGLFGFCSRAGSCVTYLVAGLQSTAIISASILATVSSAVVVAAVKSTSKAYGVNASIKTGFLSVTWIAVAFSVGAGLFWMFSMCCCKAEHRNNKKHNGEKGFAMGNNSSYQPLHDPNTAYQGQQHGIYNPQLNKPAHGAGYEPYSHAAV